MICGQGVAPAAASIPLLRDELGLDLVPGHRPAAGVRARRLRRAGCCCCATSGRCAWARSSSTRSRSPRAASRSWSGSPRPSRTSPTCSPTSGRPRPRSGCPAGARPRRGRCSATRRWPRPTRGSCARPRRPPATATARSSTPATRGCAAGWRRRSSPGRRRTRSSTPPARRHAGLLGRGRPGGLVGDDRGAGARRLRAASRSARPGRGARGRCCCRRCACSRASTSRPWAAAPSYVHTVVEALKLAFADREAFYGDADPGESRSTRCSAPTYAAERRALIGERASVDLRPGRPGRRRGPRCRSAAAGVGATTGVGEPTLGDTCHLDVADRFGNLVACTPSGGWLQSSPVDPRRSASRSARAAQMFWLEEGLPVVARRAAAGRARRCRRRSRCATARARSPSARRAATSRTSGRCSCCSTTCTSG